ncbi:MAG: sugar phosphate isomerase/epimerase [Clostridia bacterium]|nr:sugar phosphate isomerase/epimerase [Clostridia bacterium]
MHRILCSTGALLGRANGRDFRLLETLTPQLHCDGYELMIYQDWYSREAELLSFLRTAGLTIPVIHCQKDIGMELAYGEDDRTEKALRDFALNCRFAAAARAEKLVLHLWSGQISDQHIGNNLAAYGQLSPIARDHGLTLTIENVVCNQRDPMTHLSTLAQRHPDAQITFDTKNAAFHSQLEALYQPENGWLGQRVAHYHVNDYGGGHMQWERLLGRVLPMGEGHINFQRFFDYVKSSGYTGDFTVEATAFDQTGAVDVAMLNGQFQRIAAAVG